MRQQNDVYDARRRLTTVLIACGLNLTIFSLRSFNPASRISERVPRNRGFDMSIAICTL